MSDKVEAVVVGAGVVGLAIARALSAAGVEVLIIESAADIGTGTSSRNSEVIHAGIYYPPGSLKAKLCARGRDLLYEFCEAHGVASRPLGKLIVATRSEEHAKLDAIAKQAAACGVTNLQRLTAQEAQALEPEVNCTAALLSPRTGIVDGRGLMMALLGAAEANGATLALHTRLVSVRPVNGGYALSLESAGEGFDMECKLLVNAAGLGAWDVARATQGLSTAHLPGRWLAKGCYCSVSGKSPFSRLIYPVPVPGALGIHATLDMQGQVRLGPDITWIETLDYTVPDEAVERFRAACLPYWPGLAARDIAPAYAGVRPKIHGPDAGFADFRMDGPSVHGLPGLVNLFGIESPGLTSSLAIAEAVSNLLQQ